MADQFYKVKKFPGQKKWGVYDRKSGQLKATSTKSKWHARVAAHIKGDNSATHEGPLYRRRLAKEELATKGPHADKFNDALDPPATTGKFPK